MILKNSNITDEEVIQSCAIGMIPLKEVPSFSKRERYLCRTAQQYLDILQENVDELEDILWRVLEDFCIKQDEDETKEGRLFSHGSEGAKMAFKYFGTKEGAPEHTLDTSNMIEENWE